MRQIKVCPSSLADGFNDYSPKAVRTLFAGKDTTCRMDLSFDDGDEPLESTVDLTDDAIGNHQHSVENLSISGAQEKYPAILADGKIRIARNGERSTYILKPAPLDHLIWRKQIPANEHLTMQIASQVYGIETALNGLCFTSDDQAVYVTKRFDILPDGSKLQMEDFASLIGCTDKTGGGEYKYEGSYDDIAKAIVRYVPASKIALEKFLRLVVFNYIFANGDAHLKNFSVIRNDGDCMLAPAYDLINTFVHLEGSDFALRRGLSPEIEKSDVYERTGHPCRLDFERFGIHIGISKKRVNMILDEFMEFPPFVDTLIARSFFHQDRVRRSYKRIIEERRQRYIRQSE